MIGVQGVCFGNLRAAKFVVLLARRNLLLCDSLLLFPGHGYDGCVAVDDNNTKAGRGESSLLKCSAVDAVVGQLAAKQNNVQKGSGSDEGKELGPIDCFNCRPVEPIVPDGSLLSGWALQRWLLGVGWSVLEVPVHPMSSDRYFVLKWRILVSSLLRNWRL